MVFAHPTKYKGLQFRSRLEACWACFFDSLGWDWEYEPFDLDGYTPDFVLRFPTPLLVEVKPANSLAEMEGYTEKIETSGWEGDYLIVGTGLFRHRWLENLSLGLIAQAGGGAWSRDDACLGACPECSTPTFVSVAVRWGSYACSCRFKGEPLRRDYSGLWARAKNTVQWKPPARRPVQLPPGFGVSSRP